MQAPFPVRSIESPLSTNSLKNSSMKASLDSQASLLRIDESLSPASLDSVVVAERDARGEKYANASPINSPECVEADQVKKHAVLHLLLILVGQQLLEVFINICTS